MADLPIKLQTEVGYALWWLTHPEKWATDTAAIVERLMARGYVTNREEARAVAAQARQNMAAQKRIVQATGASSLKRACDYKCPDETPIALRIRVDVKDERGTVVESRSIVVNARAFDTLDYVLTRAREIFNRRYRSGTTHRSGRLHIDRALTPADIDQVLIGYTEGSAWV